MIPPFPQGSPPLTLLGLESGEPTDLEDGEIIDNLHASKTMDKSKELGHGAQPMGSALSDMRAIRG